MEDCLHLLFLVPGFVVKFSVQFEVVEYGKEKTLLKNFKWF